MSPAPTVPGSAPDGALSDFDVPWCEQFFHSDQWQRISTMSLATTVGDFDRGRGSTSRRDHHPSSDDCDLPCNTLVASTLWTRSSIRACATFASPSSNEVVLLFSLGAGVQSAPGRCHGAVLGLLLDEAMGAAVERAAPQPGARFTMGTARLETQFLRPVSVPAVLAVRAWIERAEGRKVDTGAQIEDRGGAVCARGKGLFMSLKRRTSEANL